MCMREDLTYREVGLLKLLRAGTKKGMHSYSCDAGYTYLHTGCCKKGVLLNKVAFTV